MIDRVIPLCTMAIQALPATQQRLFACRTARRAFARDGLEPGPVSLQAIEAAERHAVGQASNIALRAAHQAALVAAQDNSLVWLAYDCTDQEACSAAACTAFSAGYTGSKATRSKADRLQERASQLAHLLETLAR